MKKWVLGLTVVLLIMGIAGYTALRPLWANKVYDGVSVDGVQVGGVSREEMSQLLTVWQNRQQNKNITLYYGDTRFYVEPKSIDFAIDIDATIEEAWNFGRRGTLWERLQNIRTASEQGYRIPVRIRYNDNKLSYLLDQWRETIDQPSRNAALSVLTGAIVPQEPGRQLEIEAVRPLIVQALRSPEAISLPLPVKSLEPEITVADINQTGIRELLATYTTKFDAKEANRSANIKLSARRINGQIIYPGRTFSFNEIVGPREKNQGFKEALEIVDGEFVPGIGGGVCQVSSTLYNAVLMANMEITERFNHSKPLGYVPIGRDATVAYGVLDFKFTNTSNGPVMIMAEVEKDTLVVGLFGQNHPQEAVEVVSVDRQVIPPAVIKKQDNELYLGETKVDKQGKPGYEVTTIRVVKLDGKEVKREVLAKDRYLPDNTIVKIGTKLPPFAQQSSSQ
ncbi:vancomycin resistance protein YoaR [Anaerospora hongkongensis]|uniref:Vancomycin resistance protein YoaR n=3 Tax=Anaerospora hongkongensis TaxID=244830 RepID=A0A4R1PPP6_9FIRM|nr:VanW family protein [Anaerospora hongkongensis]TCL32411.1 vancomycin resistance protein YoaR [Anaerospora hongkongensis]